MSFEAQSKMSGKEFFLKLNKDTMGIVAEFYAPEAVLIDPVGQESGSHKIRAYYEHQYKNLKEIHWDFSKQIIQGRTEILEWQMTIRHPALNGGDRFTVPGSSIIEFDVSGRAVKHHDYFDMGAFVYERIPGFRFIINFIKRRLQAGS